MAIQPCSPPQLAIPVGAGAAGGQFLISITDICGAHAVSPLVPGLMAFLLRCGFPNLRGTDSAVPFCSILAADASRNLHASTTNWDRQSRLTFIANPRNAGLTPPGRALDWRAIYYDA
jgi:hypothetical protein